MIALGCYAALAEAGLRCPADVSVAGHNDMPLVDRVAAAADDGRDPAARDRSARRAACCSTRLDGEPHERRAVLLPTELVVRGSTGPARPRRPM